MATSGANRVKRPKLVPVSEEMRRLCALPGEELLRFPDVSVRPMFGLRAFYRKAVVFAMLPDKRALEDANAIAYKLPSGGAKKEGEKWKLFALEGEQDIASALARLNRAYRKARGIEADPPIIS